MEESQLTERLERRKSTVGFSSTPTLHKLHWQDDFCEVADEHVHCGADLLLNGLN
jgi:hypothetical protein